MSTVWGGCDVSGGDVDCCRRADRLPFSVEGGELMELKIRNEEAVAAEAWVEGMRPKDADEGWPGHKDVEHVTRKMADWKGMR